MKLCVHLQVPYVASLAATEGGGLTAVTPSSGTISLDEPTTFTIQVTPSAAATGLNFAYLLLSQTYPADATASTLMGFVEISYFNFGATSVNFTSIAPNGDGTANVSATVAVDFVAPSGVTLPMSGAITTDASNLSTACAATAPSGVSGATTSYTCNAAVPIKVTTGPFLLEGMMHASFLDITCLLRNLNMSQASASCTWHPHN